MFVIADPNYMRQILDNLLTNALRHGAHDIHIRLSRSAHDVALIIANETKPGEHELSLGFGKRIIAALVALHTNMQYQSRSTKRCYVVRLGFTAMLPQ